MSRESIPASEMVLFAMISQYCTEVFGIGFKCVELKRFQIENNLDTASLVKHVFAETRLFLGLIHSRVKRKFDYSFITKRNNQKRREEKEKSGMKMEEMEEDTGRE